MNKITTTIVGSLVAAILLLASASPLQAGVASTGVTGITDVVLTFSPANGGTPVVARAQDPDGAGSAGLQVLEAINLSESTSYTLGVSVLNSAAMENLTAEILAKGVEYQLFFGFSTGLFQSPLGDGNIGEAAASLGYADTDALGLPVGLITQWTSACVEGNVSGSFRLVLKHQPGLKSASSTVETGTTDFDLTFTLNVAEDPNAPPCENEEEVIDRVTLTFTPVGGGTPVVAVASDPDGPGPLDLTVGEIRLQESTEYNLGIKVENTIEGEDITEEILSEAADHLWLFGFTEGLFSSPAGDGNVDNRGDQINYRDSDINGLPLGLSTQWQTACGESNVSGSFRVVLKHQPDGLKTAGSGIETGGTDLDLVWPIVVVEDPNAPPCENEEEVIDRVTLTFTPVGGGTPVVAVASDPDGPGPLDLTVGEIRLQESTEYNLGIKVENTIEGEDITEEILSEAADHLWLFGFTEGLFSSPAGDGNVDNRGDQINYRDSDINGLPLGLSTQWQTACGESNVSGSFRVVLKHQPDGLKTAGSGIETGGTDLDLVWPIVVVEDPNAPPCENEEEVIDRVTLTFTPVGGGTPVVAVASDPDGPGPLDLTVEDIALVENTTYDLTLKVENTIEGENITEEIAGEAADHLFFFGWTGNIFSNPAGNGNLDNRQDPVNYNDQDINGLPLGLSTRWTTAVNMGSGTFRVILKHQPDGQKTANSTIDVGGTDLDLTWNIRTVVTQTNDLERRGLKLTLSPNPAQSLLNWELSDRSVLEKDYQVVIYNQYGQVVMMQRNPTATFLHIETLSKGIYYFSIHNGREIYSNRFVKLD